MSSEHASGDSVLDLVGFAEVMGQAKRASRWSYKALGRELDRPPSTLHGWISGEHLPYQRDNDDFVRLLRLLDVEDPAMVLRSVGLLRSGRGASTRPNPYRGLEPFTAADAELFFGRDQDIHALTTEVARRLGTKHESAPLIVIGRSGVGKSSILQAGLQAHLAARAVDVTYVLAPDLAESPTPPAGVVIVDHFEFLLRTDGAEALEAAVERLQLFSQRDGVVVIGVRSDYFERASAVDYLMDGFRTGPYVLGPMTAEQVTSCINAPAAQTGRTIESSLLSQLLIDFRLHASSSIASSPLPLLSHILFRLAGGNGQQLTLADYRAIGGLEGALERSAEEAFGELEKTRPGSTRDVLCRMVELGDSGQPTRRPAELQHLRTTIPDADAVISAFTKRRLVIVDVATATLSHEALIAAWPRLGAWIDAIRASLSIARRVRNARAVWDDSGRDPSMLLSGSPLEAATTVTADSIGAAYLDHADRVFLDASTEHDQRRQRERQAARSRRLAARASSLPESERTSAALLAAAAFEVSPTLQARSALISKASSTLGQRFEHTPGATLLSAFDRGVVHASLRSIRIYRRRDALFRLDDEIVHQLDDDIIGLDTTTDGRLLLLGLASGRAIVLDTASGGVTELVTEPSGLRSAPAVAFVDGGAGAIVAGVGGPIGIWRRAAVGWSLDQTIRSEQTTMAIAASADSRRLVAASYDGAVTLWSLDDPATPLWRDHAMSGDPASAIAMNVDGSVVIAGHQSGAVRAWDLSELLAPRERERSGSRAATWINSIAFDHSGRIAAVASSDGYVRFWSVADWQPLERRIRHPTVVSAAIFHSDSGIATTGEDGVLRIWPDHRAQLPDASPTWALTVDRSGVLVVSTDRTGASSWGFDEDGSAIPRDRYQPQGPPVDLVGSGALSSDGQTLYLGTRTGSVLRVDTANGTESRSACRTSALLEHLAVSPIDTQGRSVVAAAGRDGHCPLWHDSTANGLVPLGEITVPEPALGVAISSDGRFVAATSGAGDIVFARVDASGSITTVAHEQAGQSNGTLCVAFHPVLPMLVTGSVERTVAVWRFGDDGLAEQQILDGPVGNIMALGFSPSGRRLAAGVTDGSLWIWQLSTAGSFELELVIGTDTTGVYAVAFVDDDVVISAGPPSRPQRWDLDTDRVLDRLSDRVGDIGRSNLFEL